MRIRAIAAVVAALMAFAPPAQACQKRHHRRQGAHQHKQARPLLKKISWKQVLYPGIKLKDLAELPKPATERDVDLDAYEGLAAWIDLFDWGPWQHPRLTLRRLDKRGVKAIFLQTSSYAQPNAVMHKRVTSIFLEGAHRRGMKVIAWYVPSFSRPTFDRQRAIKAIRFESRHGERFDSFGLDIEATHVNPISLRNDRLVAITDWIRKRIPADYPLSAITPDPKASLYWPNFPWKRIRDRYDVIVPMGYFTFQASGYKAVHSYTSHDIKVIRRETGDRDVPIHFIGGIADDVSPKEATAFVRAARKHNLIGASLYDAPITSPETWSAMRLLVDPNVRTPQEKKTPEKKDKKRGNPKHKKDESARAPGKDRKKGQKDKKSSKKSRSKKSRSSKKNSRSRDKRQWQDSAPDPGSDEQDETMRFVL